MVSDDVGMRDAQPHACTMRAGAKLSCAVPTLCAGPDPFFSVLNSATSTWAVSTAKVWASNLALHPVIAARPLRHQLGTDVVLCDCQVLGRQLLPHSMHAHDSKPLATVCAGGLPKLAARPMPTPPPSDHDQIKLPAADLVGKQHQAGAQGAQGLAKTRPQEHSDRYIR